jgi:hypothetical protein
MNATVAALLGSLIGGAAALLGAVFTNIVVLRTERERRQSETEATYVRALREYSGRAFAGFFIVVHAIEWITWYGDNDPDVINEQGIKSYENEVHSAYGSLLGSMAMMASLSLKAYEEMRPILSNLYNLEARTGKALRDFMTHRSPATTQELRDCKTESGKILDILPPELSPILALAETARKRQ